MNLTAKVKKILSHYSSEGHGIQHNLAKILMYGKLGGTGKMLIFPVDQGFEHGPLRSFSANPIANDPQYHYALATDCGFNAFAAPYGFLETCEYTSMIPRILKINSSNALLPASKDAKQCVTASVKDALRLGCCAIGYTIYFGSNEAHDMIYTFKELAREAKSYGLVVIIWAYPRGGQLSKDGETAIDVISYSAHMSALLGAHIIKVKPPTAHIEQDETKKAMQKAGINCETLRDRIKIVKESCFSGKRLVVFSGGINKDEDELLVDIKHLAEGGADGSIVGRNTFQRKREDALQLINKMIDIYCKTSTYQ